MEDLVENRAHQVFVVDAVELHHKVVRARDVVTLDNLGDVLELLDGVLLARDIVHADRDEGTHIEAERLGCYHQAAALNDAHILQLADALVDGRARDAALAGNLKEGRAGVLDKKTKNLLIGSI